MTTTATRNQHSRSVPVQYLCLSAAWGASFLFIKIGLEALSPAQIVLGRLVFGALTLSVVCIATRQPLPRSPKVWTHLTVVAALLCVCPFLLFASAEQHLTSGLVSIYNATTPLMTTAIALAALPNERPTKTHGAGLLIGFLGVLVVLGPWHEHSSGVLGAQATCLLATACYGAAYVYLRRFVSPLRVAAMPAATIQVGVGAIIMLALSPAIAAQPTHPTARTLLSIAALGAFGTGLAYIWNNNIISAWGIAAASTVTYLTPVVGVALGYAVLGEALTWNEPIGALLAITGIALTRHKNPPTK